MDPQDLNTESQLLSSSKPATLKMQKEIQNQKKYIQSKKSLLLAGAYEQQENKEYASSYYKEALERNPECYEAF